MSSDVAHDLRTPLTRLHNRLKEALATPDRAPRVAAIIATADQSRKLLDIFAALLRIAGVEGQARRTHFQRLDLSAVVETMVETYRPDMDASHNRLTATITPGLTINGDRRLLQQLVANLLDNVLTHTPAGTAVTIALAPPRRGAKFSVSDDGPGVATADPLLLPKRFARGEASRSDAGHGLGLALVCAIAEAHRGHTTIDTADAFTIAVDLELELDS